MANTILIVENHGAGVHWMEPRDLWFAEMDFAINSPRGLSSKYLEPAVVMLDSSLYRFQKEVSPATLKALLTIRGGERLELDEEGGWRQMADGRQRPLARP